jgi:SAM-dependent methyltransferase
MSEPTWKKYLTDYNEGLGVVYERFVLNDYLEQLLSRYPVHDVLEAPIYGMAGVTGINSVRLAQRGCQVTLVDSLAERLRDVRRIWGELGLMARFVLERELARLPFPDRSFDLAWQWAGLWYLPDAAGLLRELARVSRRLVFVAMPNRLQVGYLMRKYLIERAFFPSVDEGWVDMRRIKRSLTEAGMQVLEEGVLDVPPWPDTVMPAAQVLKRLGVGSQQLNARFSGERWVWNTMAYYLGQQPELRERVMRYAWLDRAHLPWQIKAIWAHHRYVLAGVEVKNA